jgi:hypothetical protein
LFDRQAISTQEGNTKEKGKLIVRIRENKIPKKSLIFCCHHISLAQIQYFSWTLTGFTTPDVLWHNQNSRLSTKPLFALPCSAKNAENMLLRWRKKVIFGVH